MIVAEVIAEPNDVVEVAVDNEPTKTIYVEGSRNTAEVEDTQT